MKLLFVFFESGQFQKIKILSKIPFLWYKLPFYLSLNLTHNKKPKIMFKTIFYFIAIFAFCFSNAQSNPVELILSSDALNSYEYEVEPLKISNTANVNISGLFQSDYYVSIKPTLGFDIVIIPDASATNNLNPALPILPNPPVTIIRSTRIIDEGGEGVKPKQASVVIHPNPVQKDLTFTITNNLVNAYSIYDLLGTIKQSLVILPTTTAVINVSDLVSGNYILKLNLADGRQLTIQFIKN